MQKTIITTTIKVAVYKQVFFFYNFIELNFLYKLHIYKKKKSILFKNSLGKLVIYIQDIFSI